MIGFTVILHSVIPWQDILGFIVGHVYYYLEDVYPHLPLSNGDRLLKTPDWFRNLIQVPEQQQQPVEPLPNVNALAE
jgi:Derlin-2/3